ncbi:RNA polymerase Rpb4 (macronuclear) [Tetrahymena thermophila SB210]|uniref:DNA-directed RNA polymerase III subunit RPC9 n=1 Tax=Tetrahymena thermophila (strain SB210) TaxID=312017 RepID=Q22KC6_TETTS|nr:RNA polymerase Rpb4 [Tetrahymena thermophila SB210]EAR85873.2 RNA polymerase Rpb4 [Tetrahymena thermophila SB210]|eukprot:XP_001033536.2 RNA polymerase Rpb4 [Tetrahymena thermophila SB210]
MDEKKETRIKLTNQEAFLIIQEQVEKQKQENLFSAKNTQMTQKLFEFLDSQPKYIMNSNFVNELKNLLLQFSLTQNEIIQIFNVLPTKEIDLQLIIESCETKLDEKNIEAIIKKCEQIRNQYQKQQNSNN